MPFPIQLMDNHNRKLLPQLSRELETVVSPGDGKIWVVEKKREKDKRELSD